MAVASPQPPVSIMRDDQVMDTRTPSPVQRSDSTDNSVGSSYQPDLSAEVSMLSTKLVNAINYQTNLDDSLQQTRHELDKVRQENVQLRSDKEEFDRLLNSGTLMRRSEMDETLAKLRAELATERAARDVAEKAKKQTEGELETLTSALFEEANTMVAAARKDAEAVERKNLQLKSQLSDTETLLSSQQEQLRELKDTMERVRDASPSGRGEGSVPSTPITSNTGVFDGMLSSPDTSAPQEFLPEHPLHYSQLITPQLRSDMAAFAEFQELLLLARRLGAHSRQSSNSANPTMSQVNLSTVASTSSPSLPGAFSFTANSSPSTSTFASNNNLPSLKESKFYKRTLTEDLDPTLRLDLAPGLSFLSRRTVQASLLSGSLAVEPFPQNKHYHACALCGESRRQEPYVRKHRFRTSEEDTVPKPLCDYCLGRLRASCDFVGFLRLVREGHWRCDSESEQLSAWEESVRLRERMFWARVGGGVVPSTHLQHFQQRHASQADVPATPSSNAAVKSARPSLEEARERKRSSLAMVGAENGTGPAGEIVRPDTVLEDRVSPQTRHAEVNVASAAADAQILPTGTVHAVAPLTNQHLSIDPRPPLASSDSDTSAYGAASPPGTPFEDAEQRLDTPPVVAPTSSPAPAASSRPVSLPNQSLLATEAAAAARPSSLTTNDYRPAQAERKNSSVLARVRAIQAQGSAPSSSSLPGAFE